MPRKSKWYKKKGKLVESGKLTNDGMISIGLINRDPKKRRKHIISISKDLQRYRIYKALWRKRK